MTQPRMRFGRADVLRTVLVVGAFTAGIVCLGAVALPFFGGQSATPDSRPRSSAGKEAQDQGSSKDTRPASSQAGPSPAKDDEFKPAAGLMAAHGLGTPAPQESPVPKDPSPEAILLVSGHTSGWITPCGCPGSQAGGVARRAGYGQILKKTYPGLPIYYLDLGGFMTYRSRVQQATTAAVVDAMNRMEYEVMNTAIEDLGVTLEEARFLESNLKIPRISANVVYHDNGELAFPPYRILTIPGQGPKDGREEKSLRIGILGLLDDGRSLFAFGPRGRSLVVSSMNAALSRYVPELRSKSDLIVLLVETSPGKLRGMTELLEGVDMIVAGEGSQFITEPEVLGGVPVVAVGNQGKYLAELRVHEKDGRPAITPFVHWLDERFPEDADLSRRTEESLDKINEMSRFDIATDDSPRPPISPYVGAEKCATCHEDAWEVWKRSKHAHAFQTLVNLKRDYTVSCVYCHVTAMYVGGGGFINARSTPQMLNVQCEQCHGPAEAHLSDPAVPYGKVADDTCQNCHSPATDPHFNKETRWKAIAH